MSVMKTDAVSRHSEWFDILPKHWSVVALRWLSRRYAGGTPDKTIDDYWIDGTIPWINSGSVNQGVIEEPSAFITEEAYLRSSAKWVSKGSLVMALAGQGKTKGMIAQVGFDCTCNQSMAAIVPAERVLPRFLLWWLTSQYRTIRNLVGGEQRDGLNLDILGSIPCPLPPVDQQTTIAAFLDVQTAKLDTLVAKKQELLKKLNEKRAALISRTITRGLPPEAARAAGIDPHPKFRASGIEWIGEIPAHWSVSQFRRACLVLDCMHRTVPFVDDGIPLASIREVHGFELDLSEAKQTTEDEYLGLIQGGRQPQLGDVIYSRNATVGDAAIVATTDRFAMGQDVCMIRLPRGESRFLLYFLRSTSMVQQLESLMVGATFRRINVGQINSFWGCWPPPREQSAIASYLDRETDKIDALLAKVEAAIERVQEYRSALITAAVTGKIDVRDASPEPASTAETSASRV